MPFGVLAADDSIWVSDWRHIAGPNDPTTSDCIGKMNTPLCVADTVIACDTWIASGGSYPMPEANETYIDGYHPVCDATRKIPGDESYYPRTFELNIGNPHFVRRRYKVMTFPIPSNIGLHYSQGGEVGITVRIETCQPEDENQLPKEKGKPYIYKKGSPLTRCGWDFLPELEKAIILRKTKPDYWDAIHKLFPYRDRVFPHLEEIYRRLR